MTETYAGKPVVFIDDKYSSPASKVRRNRFLSAYTGGGGSIGAPCAIVDSGHQVENGYENDFRTLYSTMVDAELLRSPGAKIVVNQSKRNGDTLTVNVNVTNKSGVKLSTGNKATVFVIVYEDKTKVLKGNISDRTSRAAKSAPISSLDNGATETFTLSVKIDGADWAKMHPIIVVDYKPSGSKAFDMLQAAKAPITN